jgi:hypothetical protein
MSNQFPTSLNTWASGNTIESAWANALEAKIGVNDSSVATSIDYLIKNTSSKLGKIASLTASDGNFIVGNGTNWVAESGATALTSLGIGNVENTALSTWAGTTNITTLGTIATGTWNATAIADGKIASALTGKTYNALTLTAAATGFTIAGGTTSKTLTMNTDFNCDTINGYLDQAVKTTSSPSFTKLTVSDQPGARGFKSASTQTISDATFTKITLDGETFDNDNEFADSKYTAAVAGTYLIVGQVFYTTTVNTAVYRSVIYVNGASVQETQVQAAGTNNTTCLSMHIAKLSATDYVELYTYHNAGVNQTVYNSSVTTSLAVIKLY